MEPARYRYFVYKADLIHLVQALLIVIVFQLMAFCHVLILLLFGSGQDAIYCIFGASPRNPCELIIVLINKSLRKTQKQFSFLVHIQGKLCMFYFQVCESLRWSISGISLQDFIAAINCEGSKVIQDQCQTQRNYKLISFA